MTPTPSSVRKMSDEEAKQTMKEGFEILCLWSRNIAMLPLEDWREALRKAESVAVIVDPTLMRDYIQSDKPVILKEVLDAAIKLKAVVVKHQATISQIKD